MQPLGILLIAYLLGSIPFGYLIVRFKEGADVRATGSGGTGATNVSRKAGRVAGVATLILDALKGVVAVTIARLVMTPHGNSDWVVIGAATVAIVGHIFPIWLRFRGGKGVATAIGALVLISPLVVLCAGAVFIAVVVPTRYVSLGSITAAISLPVFAAIESRYAPRDISFAPLVAGAISICLLVIFAHRANIRRLLNGTESKFR